MAEKKTNIIDADDLLVVLKFINKNFWILVLVPLIAGVLAYLYAHRLPDEYGAKTQLLLGSGPTNEYQSQIFRGLTGYGRDVNQITNQMRVLQSHDLISRTLDKLDFQVSYFIVGRVKTTEIPSIDAFDLDIRIVGSEDALYGVPFNVKIVDKNSFRLSFERNGKEVQRVHPFNEEVVEREYILTATRNDLLSDDTFNRLKDNNYRFVVNSKGYLIDKYKTALRVGNEENTSILVLGIRDRLESHAKTFLDTLAYTYIDYTIKSKVELNESTLEYIDRQLTGITGILDSIETNLEEYKKERDILDLSREESEFFEKLIGFESDKREIDMKLESLSALESYLVSNESQSRILPPAIYIIDDDFLRGSLTELYNLEVQKSQAAYSVTPQSPGAERAETTMQSLRSNILVYIDNLRAAMKQRRVELQGEIGYYESVLRRLPASQREMLNIQRNLDVNQKMYVYLLEKKANTIIARAAIVPEVSIIEVSRGIGLIGPDKNTIVYYGVAGGFLFALLLSFTRLVLFDRIQNTRELKQLTRLPIMGGVPKTTDAEEERLVVTASPRSAVAESFRSIRTNLQYFSDKTKGQRILVTSLHPGEGKTFCTINIAAIIASAGKKVLILDFDMHKPKVHHSLRIENEPGLSSYIVGRHSLEEVLQTTDHP